MICIFKLHRGNYFKIISSKSVFTIQTIQLKTLDSDCSINSCRSHFVLQSRLWRSAGKLILLSVVTILQLTLRLYMLGGRLPAFAVADNPVAHEQSLLTRTLTLLYLPVFNFSLLLWPVWLSFDWSMDAVAPISDWSDPRNAITLSFYVIMGYATVQMIKNRLLMQALALATIPFIPASNLFFYVGFVVAERVLYLPSIGFCLLLGNINSLIPSVSNVIRH